MRLKSSVQTAGMRPELVPAMMAAEAVFREHGHELILTSVTDGKHSKTSLHYAGCAFDVRTRTAGISRGQARILAAKIKERLTVDYDVIAEPTHIHIEYQPRYRG